MRDLDQILLGLAAGSYVLSTPEGAVAECGMGVEALLGTSAEALAGRPTADALVPAKLLSEAAAARAAVYMHARGLLIPIAGRVSLHRTGDDDATYLLFRADVSRTAGEPS